MWFKVVQGSKWFKLVQGDQGSRFKVVQGDFQGGRPAPPRSMPRPLLRLEVVLFQKIASIFDKYPQGGLAGESSNKGA